MRGIKKCTQENRSGQVPAGAAAFFRGGGGAAALGGAAGGATCARVGSGSTSDTSHIFTLTSSYKAAAWWRCRHVQTQAPTSRYRHRRRAQTRAGRERHTRTHTRIHAQTQVISTKYYTFAGAGGGAFAAGGGGAAALGGAAGGAAGAPPPKSPPNIPPPADGFKDLMLVSSLQ